MDRYNSAKNVKFKYISPPVDIIIPFHKQYHLVGECLRSLITKTLGQIFTITVIDDCSPVPNFLEKLEKEKLKNIPIQYIRLPEHKGYGTALKEGFDKTRNPWICFMHADTIINQTDLFLNMINTMQSLKDKGIKLVSAKTNDGGTGAYDERIIGTKEACDDKIAEEALPLVCSLVHRDLFKNIGGFIKQYPYFGYEEEELFWRMKLHGFKQAVCGKAFVHHEGGTAVKELLTDPKIKETVENNKKTYINDIQELAKAKKK